jgi:hypothetical protein
MPSDLFGNLRANTSSETTNWSHRVSNSVRDLGVSLDNISFGASGGEPRQEVDPQQRRRGYRDAITYIGLGKLSDLLAVLKDIVEQLGGGMVTARGDRT